MHRKLGYYVGIAMHHYRWCKFTCLQQKSITTDTLQWTEGKSFEVTHKSKEDNLQDIVDYLHTMPRSESLLQAHTNNPKAQVIDKLRELLLQSTKQNRKILQFRGGDTLNHFWGCLPPPLITPRNHKRKYSVRITIIATCHLKSAIKTVNLFLRIKYTMPDAVSDHWSQRTLLHCARTQFLQHPPRTFHMI